MIWSSVPDLNQFFDDLGWKASRAGLILISGKTSCGRTALVQDLVRQATRVDLHTRVACANPVEWEPLGLGIYSSGESLDPDPEDGFAARLRIGIVQLTNRSERPPSFPSARTHPPFLVLDDVGFGKDVWTHSRNNLVIATVVTKKTVDVDLRQADLALHLLREGDIVTVSAIKNRNGVSGTQSKFRLVPEGRQLTDASPIRSRWEILQDEEDFF